MLSIGLYDHSLHPLMGSVVNFEIQDPDLPSDTDSAYCVGVRLVKGSPRDPANWALDHVNYWDGNANEPSPVPPSTLDDVLVRHHTSFQEMLAQFLALVSGEGRTS